MVSFERVQYILYTEERRRTKVENIFKKHLIKKPFNFNFIEFLIQKNSKTFKQIFFYALFNCR